MWFFGNNKKNSALSKGDVSSFHQSSLPSHFVALVRILIDEEQERREAGAVDLGVTLQTPQRSVHWFNKMNTEENTVTFPLTPKNIVVSCQLQLQLSFYLDLFHSIPVPPNQKSGNYEVLSYWNMHQNKGVRRCKSLALLQTLRQTLWVTISVW